MSTLETMNVGLVFGTDTGNTETMGDKICELFSQQGIAVEMLNVTEASTEAIEAFDFIIMGIPTWDFGGIQEDWEDFEEQILATKLQGKIVALYGLGDQLGYGFYFVDAMGWLHERVVKAGATVVGFWSTEGYFYEESKALNDEGNQFVGLAIDDDQQYTLTDERIEQWVAQIINEVNQAAAA